MKYSSHSEAPDKFHFWTGVSTIAGALRRKCWIDQKYFSWVPNFYIIFVAPPGVVSKSTTASIGMRLLKQVEGVKFGPDSSTWQALTVSMAEATEEFLMPNGEFFPMSAMTIVSSELGTFLDPHNGEMVDALVSWWDGQAGVWEKNTKTSGSDRIINPWINMLACTTPAWIAGNFPQYMIGGGFTSRTIFVYGDKKRQLIPYPADAVPADFKQQEIELVHDLNIIAQIAGEYTLTAAAKKYGIAWYEDHYTKQPKHLGDEQYKGYMARKQSHIHKLGMVIAASESDNLFIEEEHLVLAAEIVSSLETDMPKVFAQIHTTEESQKTIEIIEIVSAVKSIALVDLYRKFHTKMIYKVFIEALTSAIQSGYIRQVQEGNSIIIKSCRVPD